MLAPLQQRARLGKPSAGKRFELKCTPSLVLYRLPPESDTKRAYGVSSIELLSIPFDGFLQLKTAIERNDSKPILDRLEICIEKIFFKFIKKVNKNKDNAKDKGLILSY
jgi:hypothetical protein